MLGTLMGGSPSDQVFSHEEDMAPFMVRCPCSLTRMDGLLGENLSARVDGYVFVNELDFRGAIKALSAVSGPQPLLPRRVLGNWWSRYHVYHANVYLAFMDEFRIKGILLSQFLTLTGI